MREVAMVHMIQVQSNQGNKLKAQGNSEHVEHDEQRADQTSTKRQIDEVRWSF